MIEYHIYRGRHLFAGDDLIATYTAQHFTLQMLPGHADKLEAAVRFFRHRLGINPRIGAAEAGTQTKQEPRLIPPPHISEIPVHTDEWRGKNPAPDPAPAELVAPYDGHPLGKRGRPKKTVEPT